MFHEYKIYKSKIDSSSCKNLGTAEYIYKPKYQNNIDTWSYMLISDNDIDEGVKAMQTSIAAM